MVTVICPRMNTLTATQRPSIGTTSTRVGWLSRDPLQLRRKIQPPICPAMIYWQLDWLTVTPLNVRYGHCTANSPDSITASSSSSKTKLRRWNKNLPALTQLTSAFGGVPLVRLLLNRGDRIGNGMDQSFTHADSICLGGSTSRSNNTVSRSP